MFKREFKYLQEGFAFSNKNLDLFLVSLDLFLVGFLFRFQVPAPFDTLLLILNTALFFVAIAFSLSFPKFFQLTESGSKLSFKELYKITLKNTKRCIIPILVIGGLAFVLLMATVAIFFTPIMGNQSDPFLMFGSFMKEWSWGVVLFHFVLAILYAALSFSSILFSVEDKGLIKSSFISLKLAKDNFRFVLVITLVYFLMALALKDITYEQIVGLVLQQTITCYLGFVVTASAWLYYKKEIKK